MAYFDGIAPKDRVYNIADGKWYIFIRNIPNMATKIGGTFGMLLRPEGDTGFTLSVDMDGRADSDVPQTFFWDVPKIIAPPKPPRSPKTPGDLLKRRQIGIIKFDKKLFEEFELNALKKIFENVYVIAQINDGYDTIAFQAVSILFIPTELGCIIPTYRCELYKHDSGDYSITWKKA